MLVSKVFQVLVFLSMGFPGFGVGSQGFSRFWCWFLRVFQVLVLASKRFPGLRGFQVLVVASKRFPGLGVGF